MPWTDPATWSVGELVLASKMNTHIRDNLNALGRDVDKFRVIGTSGGFGERYHTGFPVGGGEATSSLQTVVGRFHAFPFWTPRGVTIDRLAFGVFTGGAAGSVGRAGIYQATSATDPYPSALIVDGGEFTCTTTGLKSATVNVSLEPDILYWTVILNGVNTFGAHGVSNAAVPYTPLGWPNTLSGRGGWGFFRDQTYGALPSTFPAGPPTGYETNGIYLTFVRYSA